MRRVLTVGLVLAVAALTAAVAFAAQSPKSLRKAIFTAAQQQQSVHYEAQSTDRGAGSRTSFVCDVGGGRGIQRITYTLGHKTGHITIEVVARTAYIRGDAFTLHSYVGFPSHKAKRDAGYWISVPHKNIAYAGLAASVTYGSFLRAIYLQVVDGKLAGKVEGRHVVGLHGKSVLNGTLYRVKLYARSGGKPLPVQEFERAGAVSAKTTISRWNEPVHVSRPARAVPINRRGPGHGGPTT